MSTILIVDDDPPSRRYLVTLLGYYGHHLLEAADAREALNVVQQQHPDLVIIDLDLPLMDGGEFARRLQLDPTYAKVPIVFVSATYSTQAGRALIGSCGVAPLLRKPCKPLLLIKAVNDALSQLAPHHSDGQAPQLGPLLPPVRLLTCFENL